MHDTLRLAPQLLEAYKNADTPTISDAMDSLGLPCGLLGIGQVVIGSKMCGQAFTVHYTACGDIKGTVGDFLDDAHAGDVIAIDNGGRVDCTVWGDIMSIYADKKGIAGTVIDGVCRDVPVIRKIGYPVFSRGCFMMTGKDRVFADRINTPVTIGGRQVAPGDLVIADDSGAVVVPVKRAEQVLEVVRKIQKAEALIVEAIEKGVLLKDARMRQGYHSLQTNK